MRAASRWDWARVWVAESRGFRQQGLGQQSSLYGRWGHAAGRRCFRDGGFAAEAAEPQEGKKAKALLGANR